MSNINKVIYGTRTLIDLTADTVEANKLFSGLTAHDASGATITGTWSLQDNVFTVNSLYVTRTDINPADILGFGTWTLLLHKVNEEISEAYIWNWIDNLTWDELDEFTWNELESSNIDIYVWKRTA